MNDYYTRSYNPPAGSRVASTDLINEFQSVENAFDAFAFAAVDTQKELFEAGTDYTEGVTTQLTVTQFPAKTSAVSVYFNGVYQNKDTWTRVGKVITFLAPIDATQVEIKYEVASQFAGLDADDTAILVAAQNAAQASANAAAASFDSFDDRYLGAKASAPTVDNDGNALIVGAKYFNSTESKMYVRGAAAWQLDTADSGTVNFVPAGTGAVTSTVQDKLRESVSVKDFGAIGDGVTDDTAAIRAAITAAAGRPVLVPSGTYAITSTINLVGGSTGTFNQGPQIIGDGIGSTIFDNQVSSGAMFDVYSGGTPGTNFLMGALFAGFKVIRTTTQTSQVAIKLSTAYMVNIEQVHIVGMAGTGIYVPTLLGDNDGSNMLNLKQVRIENCSSWAIDAVGASGHNETSFINMEQVFIQGCGTYSASATPPSGGMAWKGQILRMNLCGFAVNENCAFWIPGGAGLAQAVDIQNTAFENNKARHIFSTGVKAFNARNIQLYNNDGYTATNGIEFDAASYVVQNVDICGVVVRATSGNNAYTAFKISGANAGFATCSVSKVNYDNFGYAGQTKLTGFANQPTVIVNKTAAQSVFNSVSAIIFDSEVSDEQGVYNTTTGRYSVSAPGLYSIKGRLTITSCDANVAVTIYVYNASTGTYVASMVLNADGVTTQSFNFDFNLLLGSTGLVRLYELHAMQGSVGSRALNVTDATYNTLSIKRIPSGATDDGL